jgi:hypothetical protein
MSRPIPLTGLRELEPLRKRTAVVRLVFVTVLVGALAAAALVARHPSRHEMRFLPNGSNGIVVLDLSASISSDTYERIGTTLRALAGTNGRYGLVVFSDVAYDALPPGTPARELASYARFFTPSSGDSSGFLPQFPANPWTPAFSGGTRISAGLGLALQRIRADRLHRPGVVLVSDLDDDPGDLESLASIALAYRHLHVPVRIVALDPQPGDEQLFAHLLAGAATITQAQLPSAPVRLAGGSVPVALVLLALLVALALAGAELWAAPLRFGEGA